ncbi:DUF2634 domain-containing protein [Pararhizobium sp. BT-229]|uniref:DUF2634 domain-containing protein n=1 Tax=Pararhizobium sp. BT-229 TaxID=2986923 RepID=UPI0021F7B8A5|nr:DUF2634 domain-containing protein [Pararhizobium sp. BT-229]MCV9967794.1 DUF2634 domain-containing protein [Pararhizobium sp. BT-229]
MPYLYFNRSDGKSFRRDLIGTYLHSEARVQAEAKRILAEALLQSDGTLETTGLSVEARDLSGKTLFQISAVACKW